MPLTEGRGEEIKVGKDEIGRMLTGYGRGAPAPPVEQRCIGRLGVFTAGSCMANVTEAWAAHAALASIDRGPMFP